MTAPLTTFVRRAAVLACVIAIAVPACTTAGGGGPARRGEAAGHLYAHGAVATDHVVASEAGAEMLRRGGNAVDAAVAASFCLSIVRPQSCGIGGGGFMVIHVPAVDGEGGGLRIAIDHRETAPAAVGPDYYVDLDDPAASRFGPRAVGVPGTVAGLLHALERYGTLPRRVVLAPAIRAGRRGFRADEHFVKAAGTARERLVAHPELASGATFIRERFTREGRVQVGDVIRNDEQAAALELIAERGAAAFYEGPIAEAIVAAVKARGGPMTLDDLRGYRIRETPPLTGHYGAYEILSMPPPSSGGVAMQQVFGLLERLGIVPTPDGAAPTSRTAGPDAPAYAHLLTEAFKHAFADRARWLADPAFVEVPVAELLAPAYLDASAAAISPTRTRPPLAYGWHAPPAEDGGTSHVSVIDASGMGVACTETINLEFGSLLAVPGFGFVLNDEMDDFTTRPDETNAFGLRQSARNLPEPGKRPLSSMSPTIVLRDGRAVLVVGASGGPRIITGTTQVILNTLLFAMSPRAAVSAPRLHHQWLPDILRFEERWTNEPTLEALRALGHETARQRSVSVVQLVELTPDGIAAASDPRKGGRPAGH